MRREPFRKHIVKNEGTGDSLGIIVDNDLDGVICAYFLFKIFAKYYSRVDIIFIGVAQTKTLCSLVAKSKYTHFVMADIAADTCNLDASLKLFSLLSDRLLYLFDHHKGWKELLLENNIQANIRDLDYIYTLHDNSPEVIIEYDSSCANIIYNNFKHLLDDYDNDVSIVSLFADDLFLRDSSSEDHYRAFHILYTHNHLDAFNMLVSSKSIKDFKQSNGITYETLLNTAKSNVARLKNLGNSIGCLTHLQGDNVNITPCSEVAYETTDYKILIFNELNPKDFTSRISICHIIPDLDLTDVFDIPSGNPRRVSFVVRDPNIEDLVAKLSSHDLVA